MKHPVPHPTTVEEGKRTMEVLTIDVGGTNLKVLTSGRSREEIRRKESGPMMGPSEMVARAHELAGDWVYDVVAIGYPGPVRGGKPGLEPKNLAPGWVGFNFERAFGKPVRMVNDAAMQAYGSYEGGKMLFLGLGTGLGSALVADDVLLPLELAHLPFKKGKTYENFVGDRALKSRGKKKWREMVAEVTDILSKALVVDYVVLGGGNVRHIDELPPLCRRGDNTNAFMGGFRLWGVH